MTAATTAGAAVRTATEVASGETSIFETIGKAIKSIWASVGQTDAEVTAAVAPVAGPAAPAIGAAAAATTAASALGFVASAEIGGYVTRAGLLNVHAGETITPARINQPYQGGSNQNVTFAPNITAIDAAGVASFIRSYGRTIAQEVAHQFTNNPTIRPAF